MEEIGTYSRIEVINHITTNESRSVELSKLEPEYGVVSIDEQDNGDTLKIFLQNPLDLGDD